MNTRVQVEHPVTEIVTGVDIIQRMIQLAEGDKLHFLQEEITFRGYAIEFRINAEDPLNNFMPSFGTVGEYLTPGGPGVRLDTSIYSGYTIIIEELLAVEGKAQDIGGYFHPNDALSSKAMRPSATLNAIIDAI